LRRPLDFERPADAAPDSPIADVVTPVDPTLGFAGPSGVQPRVFRNRDFLPMDDRWRIGFPEWDRYGNGKRLLVDEPYMLGRWWDPYNQNVLKGDYPIIGQHTFLAITASTELIYEPRTVPVPTTPFESTLRPNQEEFFGRPNQNLYNQYFRLSFDLFHGDAGFKPADWRVKLTPVFNINYLNVQELALVNPDVRDGLDRARTFTALEEYFAEVKLADLGPEYDFLSMRVGSQPFVSDFRGFVFADTNRGVRLFGSANGNRDQFNLVYFRQAEKDTNSLLNTFDDRRQNLVIGNWFRQDFIWPGYTSQLSVHYNNDLPSFKFDKNNFLVRPDPTGVFQPHQVDAVYLGWSGDGHIERYNISHAFYWVVGRDSLNPIANCAQDINAQMAAVELSYDRDWARFRASFFWASGDGDIQNHHATGFDTILDNPNFAGGDFSYWQRQAIGLFGVNLVQRQSLVPDLRSSKFQGQSNFVNPGLTLGNVGVDFDLTPKLKLVNNASFLWFDKTNSLERFTFDGRIDREIGADLSTGVEYRPLLSNNILFTAGVATLLPGRGFKQLYGHLDKDVDPLWAGFVEMILTY
ncbi:MAG: hypothetical protein K1X57_21470, partial [Gemmataceae bacterium]|nr:hypothetical protein [Gemmataceae bacterium]